jgi:hypothetical protein
MKADAMSLTFLSNEGAVKIPFFQRGYVWERVNWDDILSDLLDDSKSHFLGSLILKQVKRPTGKSKEVLVIDGQQRLTTLSILIKALYDSFDDNIKKNCEIPIQSHLFYKKNQTDNEAHIKIIHSRVDSAYYKQVICSELSDEEYANIIVADSSNKINSKDNKILQCYKFFKEELIQLDISKRLDLFNRLLHVENKILVLIDLSDDEDEQAIFDTINSAGVRLSGGDIIKNALFQKAIDIFDSMDIVLKMYETNWEVIFDDDDDSRNFWDTPRPTGRLMRDNIEILLHSISVIKGFFDPDKHTLSDLSTLYKTYINHLDKAQLKDFIIEISEYAKLYRSKILVFKKDTLFNFKDNVQRLFHILNVCEISTFHPYILSLMFKYKNDEVKLNSELRKLEKYIVTRMITKKDTKNYNKICKEFINKNDLIDSKLTEIQEAEIQAGLENITNKNAALLLFWVELYRRDKDTKQSMKELKFVYSLEHIMPQKWEEFWHQVPIVDHLGVNIVNSDNAKNIRYNKIYSIGNMTLLNSSLNTSLRNYTIDRKIAGEGRKKGIKDYADLTITRDDILYPFEKGDVIWNEKKIYDRTHSLGKEILEIWN